MEKFQLGKICSQSEVEPSCRLFSDAEIQHSKLGKKVSVGDRSRVQGSIIEEYVRVDRNNLVQNSSIGRMTYTGNFGVIQTAEIGSFCSVSWGVTIGGGEHDLELITTHDFIYNDRYDIGVVSDLEYDRYSKECRIGHDVWIGANSTILRGVSVGTGAVVGANSLVSRDVPEYAIVAGNPARIIRYRFDKQTIERILAVKWWNLEISEIKKHLALFSSNNLERLLEALEKA